MDKRLLTSGGTTHTIVLHEVAARASSPRLALAHCIDLVYFDMQCLYGMLSGSLLIQDDATPTDTAPEEEDEAVSADGDNAEQDRADTKYREASAAAVAKCADDTKGQTCFICMEGIHPETNEGLVRGCSCRGAAGFAHLSCLARQAQVAVERADTGWDRWHTCGLCEQDYHGVMLCALGWACWKTFVDRPETDNVRRMAISVLGNGLYSAKHHEDALFVMEAELSMERRLGAPENNILAAQSNIASTCRSLGHLEKALRIERDVYSERVRLDGEEHERTILAASNYASSLVQLERFEEAKILMRKTMRVDRRVLGESNESVLRMRWVYAIALYNDDAATLDDLREAVATLEDPERIARRVLGGSHPTTVGIGEALRAVRATLGRRETPGSA